MIRQGDHVICVSTVDEVLLECQPTAVGNLNKGSERVVGCRQQRYIHHSEAYRQVCGDLRQRNTLVEHHGPGDAEGEIGITEAERRVYAERPQPVHDDRCVVHPSPTMRSLDACERIEDGIGVSRYANAVSFSVVADVHNDGEMVRIKNRAKSSGHPGAADPAGEQRHPMIAVAPVQLQNAPHMPLTPTREATIVVALIADDSDGIDASLAALGQQVYEPTRVVVVGASDMAAQHIGRIEVEYAGSLAELVDPLDGSVDYVWVVREGARPAPDSLSALIADAVRTSAGIIGSKIVGSDQESLVSIGLITDAFDVPYTGLDRSERDQGQYDVVREVAAVTGVSMLVRRDLLHGLGGVDESMTPLAAAIDLAQRARLRGAVVAITPASQVVFDGATEDLPRWKAEASRIRSMLKAYGPLTLLWVIPVDLIAGFVEVIVSIFLGRWYGFDWVRSWVWNLAYLPVTLADRGRARRGRAVGDAELFRFQRRGSVKIARLTSASIAAMRRRLPGDDRLSIELIGRDVRQPAFVVGVLAVLFVLVAARNLWSDGFPAVGYTLPFPSNGWDVLDAYAGGWNPAGLGSPDPLRPLLAIAGIAKIATLHAPTLSEYILGAGALLSGIWGMTRLLRTWSVPAAPALIAGVVYVAGPTAQGIAGNTYLGSLIALGVLPWALRICLAPIRGGAWPMSARLASVVAIFGVLGALSPLMLLVPIPVLGLYAVISFTNGAAWRAFIISLAGTAGGFLLLSPWIWSVGLVGIARDGYSFWSVSPVFAVAGSVVAVAAVVAANRSLGLVAGWAAALTGGGFWLSRAGSFGWGAETESVALALTGLGLAILIAVVASTVSSPETVRWRRIVAGIGSVGIAVLVVAAATIVLGGRIGLPGDRIESDLSFTLAQEGEASRSRVLLVGPADLLPGDSRTIDNGAYRVVSAPVPDLGEARLQSPLAFDEYLESQLDLIVSGETRRAGGELAIFGIKWIVVVGDSTGGDADEASVAWRDVFAGQLDLLPLSAGTTNAVFVSDVRPVGRALTSSADSWPRIGWTYEGEPSPNKRVFIAENPEAAWGPAPRFTTEFSNEVAADQGIATYAPDLSRRRQAMSAGLAIVLLTGLALVGRKRR